MSFKVGDYVRVEGDPAVLWGGPVVGHVVAIDSEHSEPWYDVEAEGYAQLTFARYMTKIEEDKRGGQAMTTFKVGDRLRVIDPSGAEEARMGDVGTVTDFYRELFTGEIDTDFPYITTDDGRTIGMFDYRFEKIEDESEGKNVIEFQVGDRIVKNDRPHTIGDGGPAAGPVPPGTTGTVLGKVDGDGDLTVSWDEDYAYSTVWIKPSQVDKIEEPLTEPLPTLARGVADLEAEVTRLRAENERLTGVVDKQDAVIREKNRETDRIRAEVANLVSDFDTALTAAMYGARYDA